MSCLNSHSQLEQSQFYVTDETDYCGDVILPQKLLKLQLLHANEGMHKIYGQYCLWYHMSV